MPKLLIRLLIPLLILIVAGLALWFVLSRPTPEIPETPTDRIHKETFTEEGAYYEIEASYPVASALQESAGIANGTQAVNLMIHFIDEEVTRFKTDTGVMTMSAEDAAFMGLGGERKYALGIDYREYGSPATLSYLFDVYLDTGGAHPNAYHRTFTFDRKTGAHLLMGELFDPGVPYLVTFSEIARRELPGIIAAKAGISEDQVDLGSIESGTEPVPINFETFYLTGADLVVVFSPYQVGPWVIGTQELAIPRATLQGLKAAYR